MTPVEHILTTGRCKYCENPIEDNDRCGCPDEVIYYLTIAVELLSEALRPLANAWHVVNDSYGSVPYIYPSDAKRAHDALEQVELML